MENLSRRTALKGAGVLGAAGRRRWWPRRRHGRGRPPTRYPGPVPEKTRARCGIRGRRGHRQAVPQPRTGAAGQQPAQRLDQNSQPLPAGLPNELRDFIEHARRLPAWTDWDRLDAAVRFNQKRGLYLGVIYGFASGMMSTVIPREAYCRLLLKGGWDLRTASPRPPSSGTTWCAQRLPAGRRDDRHLRQDAHGARRCPASAAAIRALAGRGTRVQADQSGRHHGHLAQPAHHRHAQPA